MVTVKVSKRKLHGTYRISIGSIIWYDNLEKEEVFDYMEKTSTELTEDNTEHRFELEL